MENSVECAKHGFQQETFVCQHIISGLENKNRVGFYWTTYDPDNLRPDAWCSDCEERVKKTGGEWLAEAEQELKPQILCGASYDLAKQFQMGGNPWS